MATLAGTLPETQAAWDALTSYARSIGVGISVADFGGIRTQADTTRILGFRQNDYAAALAASQIRPDTTLQQFRPIAPFGSSYHNYGAAFDVHVDTRPASLSYEQTLATLGRYAPAIGMRWGGTFTNPDTPHFELAVPLSQAQAMYRAFAASGGASSGGGLLGLNFDIADFLPGLTPSAPDDEAIQATLEIPELSPATLPADDAGEAAWDDEGSDGGAGGDTQAALIMLGLAVAGVVAWALRRKYA